MFKSLKEKTKALPPSGKYIESTSMVATRDTMSLACTVLGFDIFELWTESRDEKLHCTYVHATQQIIDAYPDLITGHYPDHKSEHKLSPAVTKPFLPLLAVYILFCFL